MTKKALEKLTERQLAYCQTQSSLISRYRANRCHLEFERQSGKLRGFIQCLCMMGVITGTECKTLYLYFFSEDRLHTRKEN